MTVSVLTNAIDGWAGPCVYLAGVGVVPSARRRGVGAAVSSWLVERGFAPADHGGDNSGESLNAPHGANGIGLFTGNGADLQRQFGGGSQRITALQVH